MSEIVLCALNARYIHSSLGLRCLQANLGPLTAKACLLEFPIQTRAEDVAERVLAEEPRVLAVGVYIWNAAEVASLVRTVKAVSPGTVVVLGGPEVSHELASQPLGQLADYVIQGEGELIFAQLCEQLLAGERPKGMVRSTPPPALEQLALPYAHYTDEDVAHRVLYVESSRGCPYQCAFCLSALDKGVRHVDSERLFSALDRLVQRGARQLKFVDRTFNLSMRRAVRLLDFFTGQGREEVFLHFEVVPERMPEELLQVLTRVGPERVQFEAGVQSMNPAVLERVGIRRDMTEVRQNLRRLVELGVHIHADLIAGLPGEDLESFAAGFDQLHGLGVHEIQLGVLKRLRGTPLAAGQDMGLTFSADPPYAVLSTDVLDFVTLQRIKRMAYLWERLANSANIPSTLPLLRRRGSLFFGVFELTQWIFERVGQVHAIALDRLALLVTEYLVEQEQDRESVHCLMIADYERAGRKLPKWLRGGRLGPTVRPATGMPPRQARHRRLPKA